MADAKRAARRVEAQAPPPPSKDLRLANATPEQVAKALLRGGAAPRPETKRKARGVLAPRVSHRTLGNEVYNPLHDLLGKGERA